MDNSTMYLTFKSNLEIKKKIAMALSYNFTNLYCTIFIKLKKQNPNSVTLLPHPFLVQVETQDKVISAFSTASVYCSQIPSCTHPFNWIDRVKRKQTGKKVERKWKESPDPGRGGKEGREIFIGEMTIE